MKKLRIVVAAVVVAALSVVGYNYLQGDNTFAAEVRECGTNAIITCGAMTADELKAKYAENKSGVQQIFSYYKISSSDVANSGTAKLGYVDANGNVTVDGKVVATNAETVGRDGSHGGTRVDANGWTVYQGPDRLKSTLSAFVFFNADGTFKSAVLRVCGNPVTAKPVVKPVYSCDSLTAKRISRTDFEFNTGATAKNGATITGYTYNFGDGTTKKGGATINHSYAKAGTYTVSVTVHVTVDGQAKDVTSDKCKTTVTVASEQIRVCDLTTNTIVTINKENFDSKRHTEDLAQCDKATYCDTETKKIVTVAVNDKKDTYTTDMSKCDTEVCRISDKTIITIRDEDYQKNKDKYTTDMSKCQETPPAPAPELPRTGVGELLGGGVGAGALTLAGYYYFASRRLLG